MVRLARSLSRWQRRVHRRLQRSVNKLTGPPLHSVRCEERTLKSGGPRRAVPRQGECEFVRNHSCCEAHVLHILLDDRIFPERPLCGRRVLYCLCITVSVHVLRSYSCTTLVLPSDKR